MIAAAAALLLAATAAPAPAADANDPDLRCIVLIGSLVDQAPADQKTSLIASVMYFFGRIDGRTAGYDLEANVRRVVPTLNDTTAKPEMERCASLMQQRNTYLQKVLSGPEPAPAPSKTPSK